MLVHTVKDTMTYGNMDGMEKNSLSPLHPSACCLAILPAYKDFSCALCRKLGASVNIFLFRFLICMKKHKPWF